MAETRQHRTIGWWLTMLLAALVFLTGLVLAAGGAWLIALGGSWYYLIAGIGLMATAVLMFRTNPLAVWLYAAVLVFTLIWAFWEAGLDRWALVPRLGAPSLLMVLVLLTLPVLRRYHHPRDSHAPHRAVAASLALLGIALGLASGPAMDLTQVRAQQGATAAMVPPDVETQPAVRMTSPGTPAGPGEVSQDPQPTLEAGADWPAYGGTHHGTRFSPLTQITRENVAQLEQVWEFHTRDLPPEDLEVSWSPEITPIKVGDDLFICTAMNIIIAIDARTGREEWRYDPQVSYDAIPHAAACRGVAYYADPNAEPDAPCATRIIEGTLDARLIAVDAELGLPCPDFGFAGQVDLEQGLGDTVPGWVSVTSPPTVVRGVIVIGHQVNDNESEDAPSGVVRGYDAVTGELVWAWDLGRPELKGEPPEGETYTRGTPNMWTVAAADEELGHVYLPMGNSSVDYYGSNRSELENEYATSIVALDATTGEPVWHFQTVRRDVWDYDLGSQPALVEFPSPSGTVKAIIVTSKQGDIFVLNRATGELLFPAEERPVPQGGVEPEYLSPTQPFSTYHTLASDRIEESEMWGITPLDQLWCRIQYRRASYEGLYTPPTADRPWIQHPGYNGGQDWGSMAVDETRGIIIANYNDVPNYNQLIPREEAQGMLPVTAPGGDEGDPQLGSPFGIDVNPGWRVNFTKLMCKEPPYGGIRAIELATGKTLWDQPLGSARLNGPFGIPSMLPLTIGTPNNGGPAVTATGLVFIAATTDNLIRAFDIHTGEELWSEVLPAGGQATPMVFESDGRQYVAIFAGGHDFMETKKGDSLVAYALPSGDGGGAGGPGDSPDVP